MNRLARCVDWVDFRDDLTTHKVYNEIVFSEN